ncbi:hypothetical protein BD779DRAFT_1469282 [Infundibulicybe gibba]|nr:hypothetical protein BD779DRAFT_1469282 [Infundibulicybe gibba]
MHIRLIMILISTIYYFNFKSVSLEMKLVSMNPDGMLSQPIFGNQSTSILAGMNPNDGMNSDNGMNPDDGMNSDDDDGMNPDDGIDPNDGINPDDGINQDSGFDSKPIDSFLLDLELGNTNGSDIRWEGSDMDPDEALAEQDSDDDIDLGTNSGVVSSDLDDGLMGPLDDGLMGPLDDGLMGPLDDDIDHGTSSGVLSSDLDDGLMGLRNNNPGILEAVRVLRDQLLNGYTCPKDEPSDLRVDIPDLSKSEEYSLLHYIAWKRTNGTVAAYKAHAQVLQNHRV